METKKICLNMIVRNESGSIRRCLDSVKGIIDSWAIVDTGSTDKTQEIIKDTLRGIPGELIERPWVDFAHNRNEALNLARGRADYILFIDADEKLVFLRPFEKNSLTLDFYAGKVKEPSGEHCRVLLARDHPGWRWEGVLHESLINSTPMQGAIIEGVFNESNTLDGQRSKDPKKYLKDAEVLEKALAKEPGNSRYMFYLGQCYCNAKEYEKALQAYQKRIAMAYGDSGEIFWSLYTIAMIQEFLQKDLQTLVDSYSKAFLFDQARAEPIYRLGRAFFIHKNYFLASLLAEFALTIPFQERPHFRHDSVYHYEALILYGDSLMAMGQIKKAKEIYLLALGKETLPASIKEAIEKVLAVA